MKSDLNILNIHKISYQSLRTGNKKYPKISNKYIYQLPGSPRTPDFQGTEYESIKNAQRIENFDRIEIQIHGHYTKKEWQKTSLFKNGGILGKDLRKLNHLVERQNLKGIFEAGGNKLNKKDLEELASDYGADLKLIDNGFYKILPAKDSKSKICDLRKFIHDKEKQLKYSYITLILESKEKADTVYHGLKSRLHFIEEKYSEDVNAVQASNDDSIGNYDKLSVKELKTILKDRKLIISGKKQQLIDRLNEYDNTIGPKKRRKSVTVSSGLFKGLIITMWSPERHAFAQEYVALKSDLPFALIKDVLYKKYRNKNNIYYDKIEIPKRNGNIRTLHAVRQPLKKIQKAVHDWLVTDYEPTEHAYGFIKGRGIIENAKKHHNKKLIIRLDIKDFFPSITASRVRGMFQAFPFKFPEGIKYEIAYVLTQICCLDSGGKLAGSIPQGGITSPFLSNMICRKLDSELYKYSKIMGLIFTRYADDITVSANKYIDIDLAIAGVHNIIEANGFEVNEKKTQVMKKSNRQVVTGIIVNKGLNVNRSYLRNLRATLHNCYKDGITETKPEWLLKKHNKRKEDALPHMVQKHFQDMRNTCSPLYKYGESWFFVKNQPHIDDAFSLNNKQITTYEAKKRFMRHLQGRIEFIGQVAKANEQFIQNNNRNELNTSKHIYDTRINQYKKLIEVYNKIATQEDFKDNIKIGRRNALKQLRNTDDQKVLDSFDDYTLKDLIEFKDKKAKYDMRYYMKDDWDLEDAEKLREQLRRLLSWFKYDFSYFSKWLKKGKNNKSAFYKIVHATKNNKPTVKEINDLWDEFNMRDQYKMNRQSTSKVFHKLFEKFPFLTVVNGERMKPDDKIDINENKEFGVRLLDFTKSTRLGLSGDKTTPKELEESICRSLYNKKPKFDFQIKSFRWDIRTLKNCIIRILHSMYQHSHHKDSIMVSFRKSQSEQRVIISIFDENVESVDFNSRDMAGGDLRDVMDKIDGVADYFILAKVKGEVGRINMLKEEGMQKEEKEIQGFTHELSFDYIP